MKFGSIIEGGSGPRSKAKIAVASALMAVFLAGCSVTPTPLTETELSASANLNLETLTVDQEPVVASIDLYEAMARALKYNLDHRVEMMQVALAQRNLGRASANMLPQLVANAGYADRNNTTASFSQTLVSGIRSAEPSFSSEQATLSGDLTFSWHILDFGLSYVRAKQAADQALIAEETKRKIVNRIIEDVRTAYWRAVSADRLLEGFRALESRVEKAQAQTRRIQRSGQTSKLTALTYERELVDIKKEIQRLDRELVTAKAQLAALMNVKPGTSFALVTPKRSVGDVSVPIRGDDAVLEALRNRPEMREILYKARINEAEFDAAILEVLPNPGVFAGLNFDTNDFLVNSNWISYGARASWNAMQVFQYPARKRAVEAEGDLITAQMRALAMAIATQVHISQARYRLLKKSATTAAEYYNIQRGILKQVRTRVNAGAASEQTLIREEMNTLVASVEFDVAFADLQNAFASVYASLGVDPHDANISTSMSVDGLASALRSTWQSRGDQSG
ncbi:MAG: TolC family protein [Pseudomonadota bacterium]